jgi:thymidylate synthase (FAD)
MVTEWRRQSASSKQGSDGPIENQEMASIIEADIIERCKGAYEKLIELGVSKEQARTILPLNLNTTFIWTGSFQAFVHLCNLRLKPDAQQETREVVAEMLQCVKNIEGNPFQHSLAAFGF